MMGIISQQVDPGETQVFRVPPGDGYATLLEIVDLMLDIPDNHAVVQTMRENGDRAYVAIPMKPNEEGAKVLIVWGNSNNCAIMVSNIPATLFISAMAETKKAHPEKFGPEKKGI